MLSFPSPRGSSGLPSLLMLLYFLFAFSLVVGSSSDEVGTLGAIPRSLPGTGDPYADALIMRQGLHNENDEDEDLLGDEMVKAKAKSKTKGSADTTRTSPSISSAAAGAAPSDGRAVDVSAQPATAVAAPKKTSEKTRTTIPVSPLAPITPLTKKTRPAPQPSQPYPATDDNIPPPPPLDTAPAVSSPSKASSKAKALGAQLSVGKGQCRPVKALTATVEASSSSRPQVTVSFNPVGCRGSPSSSSSMEEDEDEDDSDTFELTWSIDSSFSANYSIQRVPFSRENEEDILDNSTNKLKVLIKHTIAPHHVIPGVKYYVRVQTSNKLHNAVSAYVQTSFVIGEEVPAAKAYAKVIVSVNSAAIAKSLEGAPAATAATAAYITKLKQDLALVLKTDATRVLVDYVKLDASSSNKDDPSIELYLAPPVSSPAAPSVPAVLLADKLKRFCADSSSSSSRAAHFLVKLDNVAAVTLHKVLDISAVTTLPTLVQPEYAPATTKDAMTAPTSDGSDETAVVMVKKAPTIPVPTASGKDDKSKKEDDTEAGAVPPKQGEQTSKVPSTEGSSDKKDTAPATGVPVVLDPQPKPASTPPSQTPSGGTREALRPTAKDGKTGVPTAKGANVEEKRNIAKEEEATKEEKKKSTGTLKSSVPASAKATASPASSPLSPPSKGKASTGTGKTPIGHKTDADDALDEGETDLPRNDEKDTATDTTPPQQKKKADPKPAVRKGKKAPLAPKAGSGDGVSTDSSGSSDGGKAPLRPKASKTKRKGKMAPIQPGNPDATTTTKETTTKKASPKQAEGENDMNDEDLVTVKAKLPTKAAPSSKKTSKKPPPKMPHASPRSTGTTDAAVDDNKLLSAIGRAGGSESASSPSLSAGSISNDISVLQEESSLYNSSSMTVYAGLAAMALVVCYMCMKMGQGGSTDDQGQYAGVNKADGSVRDSGTQMTTGGATSFQDDEDDFEDVELGPSTGHGTTGTPPPQHGGSHVEMSTFKGGSSSPTKTPSSPSSSSHGAFDNSATGGDWKKAENDVGSAPSFLTAVMSKLGLTENGMQRYLSVLENHGITRLSHMYRLDKQGWKGLKLPDIIEGAVTKEIAKLAPKSTAAQTMVPAGGGTKKKGGLLAKVTKGKAGLGGGSSGGGNDDGDGGDIDMGGSSEWSDMESFDVPATTPAAKGGLKAAGLASNDGNNNSSNTPRKQTAAEKQAAAAKLISALMPDTLQEVDDEDGWGEGDDSTLTVATSSKSRDSESGSSSSSRSSKSSASSSAGAGWGDDGGFDMGGLELDLDSVTLDVPSQTAPASQAARRQGDDDDEDPTAAPTIVHAAGKLKVIPQAKESKIQKEKEKKEADKENGKDAPSKKKKPAITTVASPKGGDETDDNSWSDF